MPPQPQSPEALLENQGWLLNIVRHLVKDEFAAEDIVQETYLEAYSSPSAKPEHKGWLAGVARNKSLEWLRASRRRTRRERQVAREATAQAIVDTPEEIAELTSLVLSGIESLPLDQQQALMLQFGLDFKPSEVSKRLEVPVKEVYRLTERGRASLKLRLEAKHGRDWREHCAALLGIKLVQSTTTATVPLLAVAAAIIVVIGSWIGADYFADADPLELENVAALTPALMNEDLPADTASDLGMIANPLEREDFLASMAPDNDFHGVLVHVIDEDGFPFIETPGEVLLDGFGSARRLAFVTDTNGFAQVPLPTDASDVRLTAKVEGHWATAVAAPPSHPAPLFRIQARKADWLQTLRAVDHLDRPKAGVQLKVFYQGGGEVGYFTTGSNGQVDAELIGPGIAYVNRADYPSGSSPTITFSHTTAAAPIDIQVLEPPDRVSLLCVDSLTGIPIQNAICTAYSRPRGEFQVKADDPVAEAIPGAEGSFHFAGLNDFPYLEYLLVEAPGYQSALVTVKQDTEPGESLPIRLRPITPKTARVRFGDVARSVATVTVERMIDRFEWPPISDSAVITKPTSFVGSGTLLSNTDFLIPQDINEPTSTLTLTITDDLGNSWQHSFTSVSPPLLDEDGRLLLSCPAPPDIPLTITLLNADDSPIVDTNVNCRTNRLPAPEKYSFMTDANGQFSLMAYADDQMAIWTQLGTLHISGKFTTPAYEDDFNLTLKLPESTGTLKGDVVDHLGEAVKRHSVSAKLRRSIHLQGMPENRSALTLRVSGEADAPASFLIEGIPEGIYLTKVEVAPYINQELEQSTGVPLQFQMPAYQILQFKVMDGAGNPLVASEIDVMGSKDGKPHQQKQIRANRFGLAPHYDLAQPGEAIFIAREKDHEAQQVELTLATELQEVHLLPGRTIKNYDVAAEEGMQLEEGFQWIVASWGAADDPRQSCVRTYPDTNLVHIYSAPADDFRLIEINLTTGQATGREIFFPGR